MKKNLIMPMEDKYQDYLMDESKYYGYAESISFPESEEEVIEIIQQLKGTSVTIQGSKTGIVGGAVPQGGHIMNLSRMTKVKTYEQKQDGTGRIHVEAGITLETLKLEINKRFRENAVVWPPNPTETSATIGGIAAVDAKGINAYHYGSSKQYIEEIHLITARGERKVLSRKKEEGIPDIELVLGAEGILGVITELTLSLVPKPKSAWGISFFFEDKRDAARFAEGLQNQTWNRESGYVVAMEYLDGDTIQLIQSQKSTMTKIKELPDISNNIKAMVYIELEGEEESIEMLAEELMDLAELSGSDSESAWAVSSDAEIEKMHAFRHAAAEIINSTIEKARQEEPLITKLGLDINMKQYTFSEVIDKFDSELELEGLRGCVFGHIKDNHLHTNILSSTKEEYEKGVKLLKRWIAEAEECNKDIAMEHGIGKVKQEMIPKNMLESYRSIYAKWKRKLDEQNRWNQGNIFAKGE